MLFPTKFELFSKKYTRINLTIPKLLLNTLLGAETFPLIRNIIHLNDKDVQIMRIEGLDSEVEIGDIVLPKFVRILSEVTDEP